MNILRLRALRGPNLWSRRTALEALIACAPDEALPAGNAAGLEIAIRARFAAVGPLAAPPASTTETAAPAAALAHALAAVALALQAEAGCPVSFSRVAAAAGEPGTFQVVVEYREEAVGRLAFDLAQQLLDAARAGLPFDSEGALAQLRVLDEQERIGPSTGAIVDAAAARGIPWRRLTRGSLVQFGWGSRQRRIQAAEVDATSAVAESIAQDKDLTKQLLHAAGVPVPQGAPAATPDEAPHTDMPR